MWRNIFRLPSPRRNPQIGVTKYVLVRFIPSATIWKALAGLFIDVINIKRCEAKINRNAAR
jgi:hypothetical protein